MHVYYLWKKTDQYATFTGKPYNFRKQTVLQISRFVFSSYVILNDNIDLLVCFDIESSFVALCLRPQSTWVQFLLRSV